MTVRTTKKTVTFTNPVFLDGLDEVLSPGTYQVETDEELLDGLSFQAYRRVLTLIHLPAKAGRPGLSQTVAITPDALDAALKRDEAANAAARARTSARSPCEAMPKPRETDTER